MLNYSLSYNNLGNVLLKLEKYEDAIPYYKKTIELDPNHAYAHYNLGKVF